ncbi:RNA-directed RNA polymerase L [Chionoecetes opilio]|uniref:RNA-directed RNA polymerase L n=1 Tax=Chionoecetes opilio TaxID=41210 RepID=A0A8J4XV18_CHIOP|nr:RNA-directed RNA polymerase L [Chionoecetes opilio]
MEVSGISKCFTYPVVDLDKAADTVIKTAGRHRGPHVAGQHAVWMFRKIFIREFIRERRTWPKTTIIGPLNPVIAQARLDGTWGETSGEWGPNLFRNIQLDEKLNFDWHLDTTDLLSDKSIAPPLSSWAQEYDTRYSWLRHRVTPYKGPPAQKRLIIKHLNTPIVDTKESIMRLLHRSNPENQITVMCPKERELSRDRARYFTKLTFDGRLHQVTSESNMKKVFRYYPHQSMTLSGNSLTKVVLKNSARSFMKVHVDFSKFCLHQCHLLNVFTAMEIDRLFGTPSLYEFIHIFPQEAFTLFQD